MSKITKLIAQAIMELQNIHKGIECLGLRVKEVEQAIAPRTITGARIKEGTITLASMQATAVEAAITGNMPKIQNAMVTCGDLPVLKMEDFEQGEAAVKAAFGAAFGNSINGAADGAQSEALMALASILRDSGLGASGGRELARRAELKDNPSLVTAALNFSNLLTPISVLGLLDALAQSREVAVRADKAAQAHAKTTQELAIKLDRANHRLQRGYALERALEAYENAQNEKPVDGFETQA